MFEGVGALMRAFLGFAGRLTRDRKGATAVEYGFLLALIVLAVMGSLVSLGSVTTSMWGNISTKVQATN
jgi:pilus assembly protein Flp/PilA